MSSITPFLWFDTQAEIAAEFYVSVFKEGKILLKTPYPKGSRKPAGSIMSVNFRLKGQNFVALNAGPEFTFTEAVSFLIECEDQTEVDYYWDALLADGGEPSQCGWLKDKFGLSWQVVPKQLRVLLSNPAPAKAEKAMAAMLAMQKIDIAKIEDVSR